jgi:chromosome segregation ATPase
VRRHARLRRTAWCLAFLVVVTLNAVGVSHVLSTRAASERTSVATAEAHARLAARQELIGTLKAFRTSARERLESEQARLASYERQVKWVRAERGAKSDAIVTAYEQLERHQGNITSLSDCLAQVNRAMNAVSVGDLRTGDEVLASVYRVCGAKK